jgi:cytochrome c-type biogenesis protein CcmH/NrfG
MNEWNDAKFELAERKRMDAHDQRQAAEDVIRQSVEEWETEQAQPTINAIRAISQSAFSERVAVMIVRALSAKINAGNWSHFEHGQDAVIVLDELSDELEAKQ